MMKYHNELLGADVYPQEETIFFYGGIFSQWADGTFYCNSLKEYVNCAEQAMMLHKAKLFNDTETYEKIKYAHHPSTQKTLGKKVKNFSETEWSKIKFDCVKNINMDKFTQSLVWRDLLFLTYPYDRIWGIGISIDNTDLLNRNKWRLNLLGKAIVETRKKLMESC